MYKIRAAFRWLGEDEKGQVVLLFLVCTGCAGLGYLYGYVDGRCGRD